MSEGEPLVAAANLVEGVGEGQPLRGKQRLLAESGSQHLTGPQPGHVRVLRVHLPQVAEPDVARLPQRRYQLVELQPDHGRGLLGVEGTIGSEPARHPLGERAGLPFSLADLDHERRSRVGLGGREHPVVAAEQPRGDGLVGLSPAVLGLPQLVASQVELVPSVEDEGPAQVVADGGVQLLHPGLVGREEDDHVAVDAVRAALALGGLVREGHRRGRGVAPLVGVPRVQHHQPRLVEVGDVRVLLRADSDGGEVPRRASLVGEPADDLGPHVLAVQPLGLVLGATGDVGLQVVPVLALPGVEVGGAVTQLVQRRVEVPRHVTGHGHAEEDALGLDALVGRTDRGRRSEEHRPGQPAGHRTLPEQRLLRVEPDGLGVRPVHVGVDDRLPRVLQVLGELRVHLRGGERHRAGQDQRTGVLPHPEGVDHGVHQPQHPAGALEPLQARPVFVEPVEQLGMDRVGLPDPGLVARVARLPREVLGVPPVELDERPGGGSDRGERGGVGLGEQPLPDDVVRLVRRRRAPLVGNPAHHVLQALQRLQAVGAADLLGAAGRDPVVAGFRGRDRDRQQHSGSARDGFGERLGERELVVEGAAREVVAAHQAAGVGHPFVDQDDGRCVPGEQCVQRLPGRRAVGVRLRDQEERLGTAELPGEFTPQRVDPRAVGLHRTRG